MGLDIEHYQWISDYLLTPRTHAVRVNHFCKQLKTHRNLEYMFTHPKNNIVHASQRTLCLLPWYYRHPVYSLFLSVLFVMTVAPSIAI